MNKLSDLQKINVVNDYNGGLNSTQIGKKYGVTSGAILGILKRRNVEIRSHASNQRKYILNEKIFDSVDKPEKAYWLGFLLGDGCINKYSIVLELSSIDRNHIKKFSNFIGSNYPIFDTLKNCCAIRLTSKYFVSSVKQYGLVPNKTHSIITPNISSNLLSDFYRGILDSDGWIVEHKNKQNHKPQHEFGFSSANEKFLVEIKNWISKHINKEVGNIKKRSKLKSNLLAAYNWRK